MFCKIIKALTDTLGTDHTMYFGKFNGKEDVLG
jgi:hypothetical protein